MGQTDLQPGGGYTYQWERAILLALDYFFDPVRYSPTLRSGQWSHTSRQTLLKRVAYILLKVYAMSTVRQLGTTDPLYASALCVIVGSSPGSVLGTHCEQGDGKVLRYREGDARELMFASRQSTWTPEGCGSVLNLNSQPQLNLKPGGPVVWHFCLPTDPQSTTLSRNGPPPIGDPFPLYPLPRS